MSAFAVVLLDELVHSPPELPLPIGTMRLRHSSLIDRTKRSACALHFGAWNGVCTTPHAGVLQHVAQRCAPLLIPVADQHAAAGKHSLVGGRHCPAGLGHEGLVGMWRTADDLHAARGELNHEERGERHPPAPRPHLRREENPRQQSRPTAPAETNSTRSAAWALEDCPALSRSGRWSSAPRDGPRSSGPRPSACSPRLDSLRPSA
jgi:hypothetical protein